MSKPTVIFTKRASFTTVVKLDLGLYGFLPTREQRE